MLSSVDHLRRPLGGRAPGPGRGDPPLCEAVGRPDRLIAGPLSEVNKTGFEIVHRQVDAGVGPLIVRSIHPSKPPPKFRVLESGRWGLGQGLGLLLDPGARLGAHLGRHRVVLGRGRRDTRVPDHLGDVRPALRLDRPRPRGPGLDLRCHAGHGTSGCRSIEPGERRRVRRVAGRAGLTKRWRWGQVIHGPRRLGPVQLPNAGADVRAPRAPRMAPN